MTNDWKVYKAEFSIDPSRGVMVSCAYFLAKDIKDILSRIPPYFIAQLRTLSAVDGGEFSEFVLVRPDTASSSSLELNSFKGEPQVGSIYEISVMDELDSVRLIYTNSLDWITKLTSKVVEIMIKYENVHILWEEEEAK